MANALDGHYWKWDGIQGVANALDGDYWKWDGIQGVANELDGDYWFSRSGYHSVGSFDASLTRRHFRQRSHATHVLPGSALSGSIPGCALSDRTRSVLSILPPREGLRDGCPVGLVRSSGTFG